MNIAELTGWIFDMDGTLTIPIHNFGLIRQALEMPEDHDDILGWLESLPVDQFLEKQLLLETIEMELAAKTVAQPHIHELLILLQKRGCKLGVITRNNILNTQITLRAAGLDHFFDETSIRTRECAAPKPDPESVNQLLELWGKSQHETVICGDFKHDLNAGINAGIHTIYFNSREDTQWSSLADITVESWQEIIEMM